MPRHPLWARTPLVLRRWPALLASVTAGALLLGLVAAATPLFLSASATDALDAAMRDSSRFGAGLSIAFRGDLTLGSPAGGAQESTLDEGDDLFDGVTESIPHLGSRVSTALGDPVAVDSANPRPGGSQPIRPVFRSGALDHIIRVEGGGGPGAWIQDVIARSLRVRPGDEITLFGRHETSVKIRVAGIYRALVSAPSSPFWEPLGEQFRPLDPDDPLPAPFALVTRASFLSLQRELREAQADFRWEYPVALKDSLDLSDVTRIAHHIDDATDELLDSRNDVGGRFYCGTCPVSGPVRLNVTSTIDDDIRKARDTIAGLKPAIDLLSIAGALVALVVLAAAGLYSIHRRRTEMRYLSARGMSPTLIGVKGGLEAALPVVIGAVVGLGAAMLLIVVAGPARHLDPAGIADAARSVLIAVPAALVSITIVSGAAAAREAKLASKPSRLASIPWELPVLVLAAIALQRIVAGGALVSDPKTGVSQISALAMIFPVLLIGAMSGLVSRLFKGVLRFVRSRLRRARAGFFLAVNRLASAKRLAITLIAASGLAFGIFLYAQSMAASVGATTTAKSFVFTGSDVSVPVNEQYEVPSGFGWPHTQTTEEFDGGRLQPSNGRVDVLGIDPDTFQRAAFWDDSFAERSLGSLIASLEGPDDGFVRIIVAGDFPESSTLEFGGVEVPFKIVGRAESFPGKFLDRTLVVVDSNTVGDAVEAAGGLNPLTAAGATSNLWIKGDPDGIERSLDRIGLGSNGVIAARDVLQQPAFVSVSRTFGFLKALGVGAAALVVIGTVLYVQSRQRGRAVAYALARRMGLTPRAHYSSLILELGAMLGLSLVAGLALGGLAASLMFARIDLLPEIPPRPLLRVPLGPALPISIALLAVTCAGAWYAHRSAERADIGEALRSGE